MYSAELRELMNTLTDEEYRVEFVSENIGTGLAFQIRHLRDSRGWTQDELAQRIDKAQQETISQWEDPNYGSYSVRTLKKLAAAFDVALSVRFVPFSELAAWVLQLTPQRLAPPDFDNEFNAAITSVSLPPDSSKVGAVAAEVEPVPLPQPAPTPQPRRVPITAGSEVEYATQTA